MRRSLAAIICGLALPPLAPAVGAPEPSPSAGEEYRVVDCLVIGPTMKIGKFAKAAGRQKVVRASAHDCEMRGGQYALADGNSVAASIALWRPAAEEGDPKAQTMLAELLEQDADGGRDYVSAASWYAKAAARNYKPAQFSLARLYTEGLGVAKDPAKAADWYAKAYGVDARTASVRLADPAELVALQSKVKSQGEQLQLKDSEIAGLKQSLGAKEVEVARLTQTQAEDRRQIVALQDQLTEQRATLSASLDKGASALRELSLKQKDIEALRRQVSDREADLASREQAFAKKQAELTQDTTSLLAARTQLDAKQKEIADLRGQLAALQSDLATRAADRSDAVKQRDALQAELVGLRAALETKTRDTGDKEAALAARERALAAAEAAQSGKQSQTVAEMDAAGKALEAQRREIQADRATLAAQREDLKASADAYQLKLASVATREAAAKTAEDRYAAALSQVEARETAVSAREADLVKTGGLLASQKADRAALDAERASLQAERIAFTALKSQASLHDGDLAAREQVVKASFADISSRAQALDVREANVSKRELEAARTLAEADSARAEANELREKWAAIANLVNGGQRGDVKISASAPAAVKPLNVNFGKFYAILIGNEKYSDPRWEKLDTPVADVDALGDILTSKYGFTVKVMHNANREEILRTINERGNELGPTDNLLIYYAGHGRLVGTRGGERGYWEPVDADADPKIVFKSISADDVIAQVGITNARKVLVISDSCFSGAMTKERGPVIVPTDDSEQARVQQLRRDAELRSRVMMTSGNSNENVADGGGLGHSVFAQALLVELRNNQGPEIAQNVYSAVRRQVGLTGATQEPQYRVLGNSGHEGGDFIFVPAALMLASK